jgi:CRISPR/Cas system-associated exonuclease Cas4 (RecB family)
VILQDGRMASAAKVRVESPTSILTYMQCPRKYYYRYVKRFEVRPNIHLVLGRTIHSAIEAFHKVEISALDGEASFASIYPEMMRHFIRHWKENTESFQSVGLSTWEKTFYLKDGLRMLDNFYRHHMSLVRDYQCHRGLSFSEAFERLRPQTEMKLFSERLGVIGIIDAVHDYDGKISILDYKTSKKEELDEECMIQLSILTLLYKEEFRRTPDTIGIHFLRHGLKTLPVIPDVLEYGEKVCSRFRWVTDSSDISEYPQKRTGLCKHKSGECDYYDVCVLGRQS